MFKGKSKAFKTIVLSLGGLVVLSVAGILGLGLFGNKAGAEQENIIYNLAEVSEEKLTSATLLTGTLKANEEQYVYYDSTKGELANVAVNVGDQVQVGQVLVSYSGTDAQRNLDSAWRALNKIDQQIYDLTTYGVPTTPVETPTPTGDEEVDTAAQVQAEQAAALASQEAQRNYNKELTELQYARADAVDALNKAQSVLDEANVKSTVAGTVVEVNRDVTKSATSNAQTVVHVVNNASLVVAGEMSEYNLANIKVDQEVSITSKVYPDKTWTGKVSYISEYPSNASGSNASSGSSGTAAKYPFKVTLTSDRGELKQGFTVSIQVEGNQKGLAVPVMAVLTDDGTNYYVYTYDKAKKTIKRVDVEIGSADGANQQIISGLNLGETVIADPSMDLMDGQEVTVNESATN